MTRLTLLALLCASLCACATTRPRPKGAAPEPATTEEDVAASQAHAPG